MKICSNCGKNNPDSNKFCLNCGTPLPAQGAQQQNASQDVFGNQGGWTPPQRSYPSAGPGYGQRTPGGSSGSSSIWGPFAGMGEQNKHDGWLMNSKGDRVKDLIVKVNTKFSERNIPGARIEKKILQAKGLLVEQRPYFIVQRDQNSVALYINRFGEDLFISLTSFLKSKLSIARIVVVSLVFVTYVLSQVITLIIANSNLLERIVNSVAGFGGQSGSVGWLLGLLCLVTPIGWIAGLLLTVFAIISFYKLITDKDILFFLRAKPDAFVKDDLMALEKAVEQTVKMSIDEIGLDVDDLKQINLGAKRRII